MVALDMMFLMVFRITTPASDYLQTKNLDYAQAWRLVSTAQNGLRNVRNHFNQVMNGVKICACIMSQKLDQKLLEPFLEMENIYINSELLLKSL